jgi:hypothetical protein
MYTPVCEVVICQIVYMEKGNFKSENLKVNVKGQFTHYEWPPPF